MARTPLPPKAPPPPPRTTQNIWRSMRMLRRFSIRDLAASCERAEHAVGLTVYLWAAGGYLRRERSAKPHARYVIIRDTGPLPPAHAKRRGVLIDRNNGETHPIRVGWWPGHPRRKNGGAS